ncbi:MAG: hypothetical protein IJH12_08745 [Clostridia bacterium]|nr:hypothetical protein [Clostridia bacterium]
MNYKEDYDIMKFIKHIKDINQELANPSSKMRDVIINIRKDIPVQSNLYEMKCANMDKSKLTSIYNIDINVLYQKLPEYKSLCEIELINKVGKEMFDEIKENENLY